MFGLSDLATKLIGAAALALFGFAGGCWVTYKVEQGTIQSMRAADAAALAQAAATARAEQTAIDAKRLDAAVSQANAQVRVVTQHEVVTKEIPVYVKDTASCITFGLVRVLHAAATGTDPAGDNYTAGQPDDACAPVSWRSLAGDVADDYATGRSNAAQLDGLIGYVGSVTSK